MTLSPSVPPAPLRAAFGHAVCVRVRSGMKATLFIDIELLEPATVGSVDQILNLHPTQIFSVAVRLKAEETADDTAGLPMQVENSRNAIQNLISLAQHSQPEGTLVTVWFQGRSESFHI